MCQPTVQGKHSPDQSNSFLFSHGHGSESPAPVPSQRNAQIAVDHFGRGSRELAIVPTLWPANAKVSPALSVESLTVFASASRLGCRAGRLRLAEVFAARTVLALLVRTE